MTGNIKVRLRIDWASQNTELWFALSIDAVQPFERHGRMVLFNFDNSPLETASTEQIKAFVESLGFEVIQVW